MSIRIVSHCYAKELPLFADALRYQCTSLLILRPAVPVKLEICCTEDDQLTMDVLGYFRPLLGDSLCIRLMPPERLWRRSIGRNEAAKESAEDLVWFCDVDYVFGPNCLNSLWYLWCWAFKESEYSLFYPSTVHMSLSHEVGDKDLTAIIPYVDPKNYTATHYSRAIGGAQIVRGEDARRIGYLGDDPKWQRPEKTPFPNTREDVAARKAYESLGGSIGLEIHNVFRIRHSVSSYRNSSK